MKNARVVLVALAAGLVACAGINGQTELKDGYESFEKNHRLRSVRVTKDGRYEFLDE